MADNAPDLKTRITEDMKSAMRTQDKRRLGAIRLITAAIKQYEVDFRLPADDTVVNGLLDKMQKQRREALAQYQQAGRADLVEQEVFELDIIKQYLPTELSEEELAALINQAITQTNASLIKDMGIVMAWLKPKVQGRADMAKVGKAIKDKLK